MEIVRTHSLSFGYDGGFSLDGVELSVGSGEMLLVCGASGCGKSTLLRLLKPELSPHGRLSGSIAVFGRDISELDPRSSAADIGYVGQQPGGGAVAEDVLGELSFLPQNLGLPAGEILRRIAEVSAYFGLEKLMRRPLCELSEGQKRLTDLAAVMVGRPRLLLLDEPTAQLDTRSAEVFLDLLDKLRRELGTAVVICEHNIELLFGRCESVLMLENGRQSFCLPPDRAAAEMLGSVMEDALPLCYRLSAALGLKKTLSNAAEAAGYLADNYAPAEAHMPDLPPKGAPAIELRGTGFRYEKHSPDLISRLDMTVNFGELTAICGANGAGKSTLLKLIAGGLHATDGSMTIDGKRLSAYRGGSLYRGLLTMLPSDPHLLFTEQTVMLDLLHDPDGAKRSEEEIYSVTDRLGLGRELLSRYSFDLSGGELQRAALAKLMLLRPRILLLDEPEKGLDPIAKKQLGALLTEFAENGGAVLFVTHDLNFAADYADRVVMLFGGSAAAVGTPAQLFSENSLYTTSAALAARGVFPECVSAAALIERCLAERGADREK